MDELIIEDLREAQVFALEAGALVIDGLIRAKSFSFSSSAS